MAIFLQESLDAIGIAFCGHLGKIELASVSMAQTVSETFWEHVAQTLNYSPDKLLYNVVSQKMMKQS